MSAWLVAAAIGILAAAIQYVPLRVPSPARRGALASLRAAAVAIIVALLFDAPLGRARPRSPSVFVDASLSMTRENAPLWQTALDTARAIRADSVWFFGDTVRPADPSTAAADAASRVRPI